MSTSSGVYINWPQKTHLGPKIQRFSIFPKLTKKKIKRKFKVVNSKISVLMR